MKFLFSKFHRLYLHGGYGNLYRIGDNNSVKCFSNYTYEGVAGLGEIFSCKLLAVCVHVQACMNLCMITTLPGMYAQGVK